MPQWWNGRHACLRNMWDKEAEDSMFDKYR